MFSITLQIQHSNIQGTQAVDFFRRLGLPENSLAITANKRSSQYGANDIRARVDEAFARAWFAPDASDSIVTVPVDFLVKGDVRMACDGNRYAVTLSENMGEARAKELYVACRFAACRSQVARLKEQNRILKDLAGHPEGNDFRLLEEDTEE